MKPATAGGPYKVPRQHDGMRSMLLALAMHLGLLLFLWVGIRWQNNEPVAVEAEVWDMQVQSAAPPAPPAPPAPEEEPEPVVKTPPPPPAPPVEAPPQPKEPDIALERLKAKKKAELEKQEELKQAKLKKEAEEKLAKLEEKRLADKKAAEQKLKDEKDEKDKLEKEKKDKLAAEKAAKAKQDKLSEKAAEKARAAEMQRITGAVGAGTSGTAAKSTGPRSDGSYEAAIKAKIKSNLVYATSDDTLTATFKITQLPTGEVIGVRKTKGSGSAAYDNAIENAINKSSPLPKKKDGTVEREFEAVFTMKDLH
jgi:colicin import membrane protein